jgi:tetratricopeptide (TPR) repeat protein
MVVSMRRKSAQNPRDEADRARDERRWREAARLYRIHLAKYSDDFSIWVQCGHAEKESGEFDLAEQCYLKAREISDNDADLHLQIGHLYKLMGRFNEAAKAYQRSIDLDAKMTDAAVEIRELERESCIPISGNAISGDGAPTNCNRSGTAELNFEVPIKVLTREDVLVCYMKQELSDTQIAVLLRVFVRMSPTDPSRWHTLADVLDRLREDDQALRCRRIAASLTVRSGNAINAFDSYREPNAAGVEVGRVCDESVRAAIDAENPEYAKGVVDSQSGNRGTDMTAENYSAETLSLREISRLTPKYYPRTDAS